MVWKKPLLQGQSPGNVHVDRWHGDRKQCRHSSQWRHTNPRHVVTRATKFCTVASDIFSI